MRSNIGPMEQNYKYFAFISYNSKDTEWGKCLQKKLENYRMPATLCSVRGWERKPINPVFFAPTDIQPGGLSEELQERLRASQNLIVICSPNSAQSEWVGREIEFFHSLGRTNKIHFFIVDGIPHSGSPQTECFNPILDKLGLPEILGVNLHEKTQTYPFTNISWPWMNKQRAYVQLISKLLNVEFDSIWQRHKRQLIEKTVIWILGVFLVLASLLLVWQINCPVDISIELREVSPKNEKLPPLKDAIVIMSLNNEQKTDTIINLSSKALFSNIPHKYLGEKARIHIQCKDYIKVDTLIEIQKANFVDIRRDEKVYGDVHFLLWNPNTETAMSNCLVSINGQNIQTDDEGKAKTYIPLNRQMTRYAISASIPLESDSIYMPCGKDDVILTK